MSNIKLEYEIDLECSSLEDNYSREKKLKAFEAESPAHKIGYKLTFGKLINPKIFYRVRKCLKFLREAKGPGRNSAEQRIIEGIIGYCTNSCRKGAEKHKEIEYKNLPDITTVNKKDNFNAIFYQVYKIAEESSKFKKTHDNFSSNRKSLNIDLLHQITLEFQIPNLKDLIEINIATTRANPMIGCSLSEFLSDCPIYIEHDLRKKYQNYLKIGLHW